MKILTATLAAAIFAASGATAMASSDNTVNDVTVVSVDRAAGSVTVDSFGVLKTLDADQEMIYVPLDVAPGQTLRLEFDGGSLENIRPLG
ncbi:MAG: hypothetical protein RIC24_04000 [Hyphomicrobiales bacterium]|jgi:ABC-type Fe3+-siderophore transport system permease subunit